MEDLKKLIRDVPDFPKPGIIFKDITPLLQNPQGFKKTIDLLHERYAGKGITKIAAVESRGFIFGGALSLQMGVGFVPVRKPGKLPWTKIWEEYTLEYGVDRLELHTDAVGPSDNVLILDDLLATGGTINAVTTLIEREKARVDSLAFVVELGFLNGRAKLPGREIFSLLKY